MEQSPLSPALAGTLVTKKDYTFGVVAGLLIGALFLPVLKTAKPQLFDMLFWVIIPGFALIVPIGLRIAAYLSQRLPIIWQMAKFIVIGVLNTFVDLGILSLLVFIFRNVWDISAEDIFLTLPLIGILSFYSFYKAISFVVANMNSYYWNKHWTFEQGAVQKTKAEFVQFFAVSIVGFLLNVTIASLVFKNVHPIGGLNSDQWGLIGALCGTIAGLAWNFIGYKLWVFKK